MERSATVEMFLREGANKRVPLALDYFTVDINFLSRNSCEF